MSHEKANVKADAIAIGQDTVQVSFKQEAVVVFFCAGTQEQQEKEEEEHLCTFGFAPPGRLNLNQCSWKLNRV